MTTTEMRPLRPDDGPLVRNWLERYLREHRAWWEKAYGCGPESPLEELVRRDWEDLLEYSSSPDAYVGVMEAASPIGIVSARLQQERFMGFDVGILAWIYVAPEARGRGVADSLLEAAGAWMTDRGVRGRQVYVTIENAAAVKLYERHGYRAADLRMLAR